MIGIQDNHLTLLHADSLSETLTAVTDAFVDGVAIPATERERVAVWLAGRQGQPGSYRGFAAPTPSDYQRAARLYTGEALTSGASIGHILGEEAARCLIQLQVTHADVQRAIARNVAVVEGFNIRDEHRGYYCCGKCSLAMWRYLRVSSIPAAEHRIQHGLRALTHARDGKGRWRAFPYYYTLFTLLSLDLPDVVEELRYAAPSCERLVRRAPAADRISHRRHTLAQRVLATC